MKRGSKSLRDGGIPVVDIEAGRPNVRDALEVMERGLQQARTQNWKAVKFIHGYGSSGVGGEIRIAVQKRLRGMENASTIRACIFGEDWSTSDTRTWEFLKTWPQWKGDNDLGRRNLGITVVVLS